MEKPTIPLQQHIVVRCADDCVPIARLQEQLTAMKGMLVEIKGQLEEERRARQSEIDKQEAEMHAHVRRIEDLEKWRAGRDAIFGMAGFLVGAVVVASLALVTRWIK